VFKYLLYISSKFHYVKLLFTLRLRLAIIDQFDQKVVHVSTITESVERFHKSIVVQSYYLYWIKLSF